LRADQPRHELTTYFDSDDLALRRRGYSLRIRDLGGDRVQTLKKVPADGAEAHQRNEWEWKLPGNRLALRPLGEVLDAEAELAGKYRRARSKFVTEISRRTYEILCEGAQIEAVIDEGVVRAGDSEEEVSEIELEIKNGPPGPAYRLALDLLEHEPLSLGAESKADRGYRLLTGNETPAGKSRALALPRGATLEAALKLTAESALRDFIANMPAAHGGDPEGVHQMRVALRRLRTMLVLFGPFLEPCAKERFSDAVRDIAAVLGGARDWDVFADETLRAARQAGIHAEWIGAFEEQAAKRREYAHREVRALIDGKGPAELVLGIEAWLSDAGWTAKLPSSAGTPVVKPMRDLLDRVARKVARRGRDAAALPPQELHPLRKSIKKLRYSSESAGAMYSDRRAKDYVKRCKKLQTILGAINDAQVTLRLVQKMAPAHSAAGAPAAGAFHKWNLARQNEARKKLAKAWRKFERAEPFWQ
jgi:inorganic triphosphatase YgiF